MNTLDSVLLECQTDLRNFGIRTNAMLMTHLRYIINYLQLYNALHEFDIVKLFFLKFKIEIFEKMEIFGILTLVIAVVNCQYMLDSNDLQSLQPRIQKRIFPLERILNKGLKM